MHIREATVSDVPKLTALAQETWLHAFGHRFSEAEQRERIEKYRSETFFTNALLENVIYLAEEEDALLGYVMFGPPDLSIPTQLSDREITRLYVAASHQRKGIGKSLLTHALNHPAMREAPAIYLDVWKENRDAIRLYESFGFRSTEHVEDDDLILVRTQGA